MPSPRPHVAALAAVFLLVCPLTTAPADPLPEAQPSVSLAAAPPVVFVGHAGQIRLIPPRVDRGPVVDGRLDDAVWHTAAVLDSFTQGVPLEGVPDSLGTQCLVMFDDRHLYIGFRCTDDPRSVQSPITPRDNAFQGDYVCVNVDGFDDRQRSQFFCANARGIQMDGMDIDGDDSDMAPDYLYASKGSRNGHGWEVEMRIPLTTLRFPSRDTVTFGFNASRFVKRTGSNLFWAPVTKNINSFHAQMGAFEGLAGLTPGHHLQVTPTYTQTRTGERVDDDTFTYDDDPRPGVDLKYGVTSGITLDGTVQPDFSQVEADASVISVNERFAIFFPEKRPFFLEGSDLFATPINAVYTRRIVDPIYGAKLTGTAGRGSLGVLGATDRFDEDPTDLNDHDAQFAIARFKRNVLANSFVGVLGGAREQGDDYNRIAGVDGRIHLTERVAMPFQRLQSWSSGIGGQRTTGDATSGELEYGSEHLDVEAEALSISPSFQDDMGFVPRTDQAFFAFNVYPHLLAEGDTWFTGFHPIVELEETFAYGDGWPVGRLTDNAWRTGLEVRFPRASYVGVGYRRLYTFFEGQDFPGQERFQLWGGSDRFEAVRGSFFFRAGDNVLFDEAVPGKFWALELETPLRANEQLDATFSLLTENDRRTDDTRFAEVVIPRLRVSYQFNRELAVRTIGEYASERRFDPTGAVASTDRAVALDGLLSYVLQPGTVAYLGYGTVLTGPEIQGMTVSRNNVFVKVSFLWQR